MGALLSLCVAWWATPLHGVAGDADPIASGEPAASTAESPEVEAAPDTLDALLAAFAELPGLSARFREEKQIALLAAPLVSEGSIYFAPPDRLLRRQETPETTSVLFTGDTLVMRSEGGERRIDLAGEPIAGALARSFRSLLAGDRAQLEEDYTIELRTRSEPEPGWIVTLIPRDAGLQRALERIQVSGRGVRVRELRIREASGDTTTARYSDVDPARRFSPRELPELFRGTP